VLNLTFVAHTFCDFTISFENGTDGKKNIVEIWCMIRCDQAWKEIVKKSLKHNIVNWWCKMNILRFVKVQENSKRQWKKKTAMEDLTSSWIWWNQAVHVRYVTHRFCIIIKILSMKKGTQQSICRQDKEIENTWSPLIIAMGLSPRETIESHLERYFCSA
jgi:hypothetical protein